ncbi:hypothetical protein AAG747_16595 [Rapidithrix thailandica]|uniref:NapC/NirT cytochrome c N-terminal domain-containing protein n=1 Tax=Rapidithrix thailandica TaxID=413964 RepID=A0AAW9SB28_9BACT
MFTETVQLVQVLGVVLVVADLILLLAIALKGGKVNTVVKRLAFPALIVLPILIAFLGNYHVFETSKKVKACMQCHVMKPFANDMLNDTSTTLAARHYQHNWIPKDQCYGCHKDYGLNGTLKAKLDGYRHLMRYITRTYVEPIQYRGEFQNANCLSCHQQTKAFESVEMHRPLSSQFADNSISCMNCHGRAHPSRQFRTPGHPHYKDLMSGPASSQHSEGNTEELKKFVESLPNN